MYFSLLAKNDYTYQILAYLFVHDENVAMLQILTNADCCFVSYYAFMLDVILDNDG